MPDPGYDLLNRHLKVSRETFERLSVYHDLLLKWQAKINLISNDSIPDIWTRHFLDSAQLINHIPSLGASILDIGAGAGFPGMVTAILGAHDVHLVESDGKKVAFLREVSRETETPVSIHHERAENVRLDKCDIILSRACSDLNQLLRLCEKNVSRETFSLFHKGKNYSNELEDADKYWSFEQQVLPSVTDPNGVIIKLSHIHRRAP
mgnify:CR=1 FL=1